MNILTNPQLISAEVQEFVRTFDGEITQLALKGSPFPEVTISELIQQIEGFQKTRTKLPTWHTVPNIFFPKKLNIEQSSSEITAQYKSKLLQGKSIADLTGGYGVDVFYFSKQFDTIFYFEKDKSLAVIAAHNFAQLGANNIVVSDQDGLEKLETDFFDVIYLDPARRNQSKGKVYFLKDCEPNVLDHLDLLMNHCKSLLVKTSPLLDITMGVQELKHAHEIHVVAVENEVKELVWLLKKNAPKDPTIKTVNLSAKGNQLFEFIFRSNSEPTFSNPKKFIYEPNAALLKSGGYNHLCKAFQVEKLAEHSHLFTHNQLVDFPGRAFEVKQMIPYKKREMLELKGSKANITTRNFPLSVSQLRTEWGITDGGHTYLFFTTLKNGEKVVLVCEKPR
ncbi:MAG: class I SAM-dependent methyltransferase [Flavobacteriaceae bacterium]